MTKLSTGDWFDLRGVYAIRAFDTQKEMSPCVALSFNVEKPNTFMLMCATYEEAKLLRDEIAGLVNRNVSVYLEKPLAERMQKRLIEKPEILEELKRRLNEKDIVE